MWAKNQNRLSFPFLNQVQYGTYVRRPTQSQILINRVINYNYAQNGPCKVLQYQTENVQIPK